VGNEERGKRSSGHHFSKLRSRERARIRRSSRQEDGTPPRTSGELASPRSVDVPPIQPEPRLTLDGEVAPVPLMWAWITGPSGNQCQSLLRRAGIEPADATRPHALEQSGMHLTELHGSRCTAEDGLFVAFDTDGTPEQQLTALARFPSAPGTFCTTRPARLRRTCSTNAT